MNKKFYKHYEIEYIGFTNSLYFFKELYVKQNIFITHIYIMCIIYKLIYIEQFIFFFAHFKKIYYN